MAGVKKRKTQPNTWRAATPPNSSSLQRSKLWAQTMATFLAVMPVEALFSATRTRCRVGRLERPEMRRWELLDNLEKEKKKKTFVSTEIDALLATGLIPFSCEPLGGCPALEQRWRTGRRAGTCTTGWVFRGSTFWEETRLRAYPSRSSKAFLKQDGKNGSDHRRRRTRVQRNAAN